MKTNRFKIFLVSLIMFVGLGIYIHSVPKHITEEDRISLKSIFDMEIQEAEDLSFEEQIAYIDELVHTLHGNMDLILPIGYDEQREPAHLLENGGGYCYDFSRTIEKQLILSGFKTRHAGVYLNLKKYSFLETIMSKTVTSHSVCEVLTKKGWMAIDSNEPFYAQDIEGNIYSFQELKGLEPTPEWKIKPTREVSKFYMAKIEVVYGLYSRHGHFYKPYNAIPDFNFRELFYNL